MLKKLSVVAMTVFVIFVTAIFSYAEATFTSGNDFPFFQLGMLIIGGLILVSMKLKYDKLYLSEAIGTFALFAILVSLFTNPVIDAVKNLVM